MKVRQATRVKVMKLTVERVALQGMVEQLKIERGVKGQSQRMMRLSACAARVFVEANGGGGTVVFGVDDQAVSRAARARV